MLMNSRQAAVVEKGLEIINQMTEEPPEIFNRRWWAGRLMNMAMENPELKIQLFRFIDALPSLTTSELMARHLEEYFLTGGYNFPEMMKILLAGAVSGPFTGIAASLIRKNIIAFSGMFIAGETADKAAKALKKIWDEGKTFTVDLLGEAAVSEAEAAGYLRMYTNLVQILAQKLQGWKASAPEKEEYFPRLNISVKLSSIYSRIGPMNYEDSVRQLMERLRPILREARQSGGFINLDMEMYSLKNITLDVFTGLLEEPEFRGWNNAGIALQAYLKETGEDLRRLIAWAKSNNRRITVRLVKGAYWEYENIIAMQNGWPIPVFTEKTHTDWNFEQLSEIMLQNSECVTSAFGSHNVRSLAAAMEAAARLGIRTERYEFQMLYGMAEPVKQALKKMGHVVREYTPVGGIIAGMAYLVRRLLENTSNEGFLRRQFVSGIDSATLLADPTPWPGEPEVQAGPQPGSFVNEPLLDLSLKEVRSSYRVAMEKVRGVLGKTYPLLIGGEEFRTGETIESTNPARPDEVVGMVFAATRELADRALVAARRTQREWGKRPAKERAEVLFRAAGIARTRKLELMAWEIFEVGKNWMEADADVAEAIDYLEYYGREMLRLGEQTRLGELPGEENRYFYQSRGVGLVIAPWNFPLAISVGMVSAALVAGNAVLYKPSSLSVVNGWQVCSLFREAGLPDGVLNFIPGRGDLLGDYLVQHREVDFIAFTGSRDVGLGIVEKAAARQPGQRKVKRVIAEMGGKNAVIVDADADLDQAVPGVMKSAFGYQGQKCSACSVILVLDACFERFVERLTEAVGGITIGSPEDPAFFMGPVIDAAAKKKIIDYIEIGAKEGRILTRVPAPADGHYVSPVLVTGLPDDSRLLREEIFGPVPVIIRVKDIDEALRIIEASNYALTGGLYSRSPGTISRVREEFAVGNLYINRGITGAAVGRQPFGGLRLSGVGSKAGGPDYLRQFMEPRVVTENTMRRGFSPEVIM
jgi:RHH-type proline utilization regulon transcriptional repressor/proline dehydrogenase/delta 1-pyrroline-5-carboxylate dehydrogenase